MCKYVTQNTYILLLETHVENNMYGCRIVIRKYTRSDYREKFVKLENDVVALR